MAYGLYNTAGALAGSLGISWWVREKLHGRWIRIVSAVSPLFIALAMTAITMFRYLPKDIQRQREAESAIRFPPLTVVQPVAGH